MSAIETGWTTTEGTKIFAQYWAPEGQVKGVVCQVHGLGEHSSRYGHVAEMLNSNGYALYAFDHVGHGKSGGTKGDIPSFNALMEEVDTILEKAREQFPSVPVFLYGHSWGGNITANYLIRRKPKINGAILTGSWLILAKEPGAFQVILAKVMNLIWPSITQNNGIDARHLSQDTSVVEAYKNDPLVHPKISPRTFIESNDAAEYAIKNAGQVDVPVLLMHGKADQITSAKGTQAFATRVQSPKTLKLYEGLRHEIHNELKKSLVFADMLEFLNNNM